MCSRRELAHSRSQRWRSDANRHHRNRKCVHYQNLKTVLTNVSCLCCCRKARRLPAARRCWTIRPTHIAPYQRRDQARRRATTRAVRPTSFRRPRRRRRRATTCRRRSAAAARAVTSWVALRRWKRAFWRCASRSCAEFGRRAIFGALCCNSAVTHQFQLVCLYRCFAGVLCTYASVGDSEPKYKPSNNKKKLFSFYFFFRQKFKLKGATVEPYTKSSKVPFAFHIVNGRSTMLAAAISQEELDAWLVVLRQAALWIKPSIASSSSSSFQLLSLSVFEVFKSSVSESKVLQKKKKKMSKKKSLFKTAKTYIELILRHYLHHEPNKIVLNRELIIIKIQLKH